MANNYFRFKRFTVYQKHCSMKVNTDSCIFGALVKANNPLSVLDIGTGTGLLALMLAQRFENACIEAIEPDRNSFRQAEENFLNSPWKNRIQLYREDIHKFSENSLNRYDMVLCNPPWYYKHKISPYPGRNTAKHQDTLNWEILAGAVDRIIADQGIFYILLPLSMISEFFKVINRYHLYPGLKHFIQSGQNHPPERIIAGFGRKPGPVKESTLTILDETGNYTSQFRELLKDFYLAF